MKGKEGKKHERTESKSEQRAEYGGMVRKAKKQVRSDNKANRKANKAYGKQKIDLVRQAKKTMKKKL